MLFIFDMGGVVTNTFYIDNMMKEIGISNDEFWSICKNQKNNFWDAYQKGEINTEEFWNTFNSFSEQKGFKKVEEDLFKKYFKPVRKAGTVEVIEKLKLKHRVVCGTNTVQSHYENHMEKGDYSIFHKTYASNLIKEIKPNTSFFEYIMNAEGYTPENTFFVDDRADNCETAKKLGINTVHFTTEEDLLNEWKKYF